MKTALLFPGQGAQKTGMGKDLYEAYPVVKDTYDEAAEVVGFDIKDISFDGPQEELDRTDRAQPAILTLSVALARLMAEKGVLPACTAGHSLGEYAALVCAGVLSFADALGLVKERGRLMMQACEARPGAMVAVIGADDGKVAALCKQAGDAGYIAPANFNSPVQVVLSGEAAAVDKACTVSRELGIKRCIKLAVSGGFHSKLMDSAAEGFGRSLAGADIKTPSVPVYFNVTGYPESDPEKIRQLMQEQVNSPVQWVKTVTALKGDGITNALELGPGSVLKGLVAKTDREITVASLGDAASVEVYGTA